MTDPVGSCRSVGFEVGRTQKGATRMRPILGALLAVAVLGQIGGQETLHLGTGDWLPLTGAALPGGGPLTEAVIAAFREAGIKVEVEFFPFKRAELMLEKGELDGIFPYGRNEERDKLFLYGTQLYYSKAKFFYLRDAISLGEFNAYEDLQRYLIGGLRGSWFEPTFTKAGLRVEYVNTDLQNMQKLVIGRVDIVPMAELVAWDLLAKNFAEFQGEIASFDFYPKGQAPQDTGTRGVNLLLRKADPGAKQILEKFNAGFAKIVRSGEFKKIFLRYFPPEALGDL